jgi:membrane protein YqaA with SNARE-associated domain
MVEETKKPGLVRRIYDWVLGWAETPYGIPALFILAFAESSFFPVPPDVLLIALALAAPARSFKFAFYAMLASVLGGMLGYAIGVWGYQAIGADIVAFYDGEAVMEKVRVLYDEYGFWGILTAAITPIPYKIFTIASGVFAFDFASFAIASVLGRSVRFFLVAGLIWKFGPSIKTFIDRYFNLLAFLFVVLLIGGFAIISYF